MRNFVLLLSVITAVFAVYFLATGLRNGTNEDLAMGFISACIAGLSFIAWYLVTQRDRRLEKQWKNEVPPATVKPNMVKEEEPNIFV